MIEAESYTPATRKATPCTEPDIRIQALRMPHPSARKLDFGCVALAAFFVGAGVMHFLYPKTYERIVPPVLPAPAAIIMISGVAEIAGGVGVLFPATRRAAAWGLVTLLVAVFPANLYCAVAHVPLPGLMGERWAQWLRLPLQLPLIAWAWRYTRRRNKERA